MQVDGPRTPSQVTRELVEEVRPEPMDKTEGMGEARQGSHGDEMLEALGLEVDGEITPVPPVDDPSVEVVDLATIREGLTYVQILFDKDVNRYLYQVIEPPLTPEQTEDLDFLREALIQTLEARSAQTDIDWQARLRQATLSAIEDHSLDMEPLDIDRASYYLERGFRLRPDRRDDAGPDDRGHLLRWARHPDLRLPPGARVHAHERRVRRREPARQLRSQPGPAIGAPHLDRRTDAGRHASRHQPPASHLVQGGDDARGLVHDPSLPLGPVDRARPRPPGHDERAPLRLDLDGRGGRRPHARRGRHREREDNQLPYAVNYMASMAQADITPERLIENLSRQPVYGEVTVEARRIRRDVSGFGMDLVTAIQNAAERAPTEMFRDFLRGLVTAVAAGGSLQGFLDAKSDQYMEAIEQNQEAFLDSLGIMAKSYVTVIVAGPLFVIIMLTVLIMLTMLILFGNAGQLPLELGYVMMLGLVPMAYVAFAIAIDTIQPGT
jgi:hypothetical protein